tara:strand:- start:8492 stop:9352 length:861 start_codon:yes stop_codon:yes gene_type:complete
MIFIVIPSFNEKNFIIPLIDNLLKQSYQEFKIIISDNGSIDGTQEKIKISYPNIKLIENSNDFWWTKSINEGVNYAIKNSKSTNDYILTLNCDLSVKYDYLETLIKCSKNHARSIIGSLSVNISNNKITFGGLKINPLNAKYTRLNHNKEMNELTNNIHTDALPGRGTLIPINLFKVIGKFDNMLPHYGADYEFSMRAKKSKYDLIISHKSVVYSFVENTGLNNENKKLPWLKFLKTFFSIKSPSNLFRRTIYIYKSFPKKYFIIHLLFDFSRVIIGTLRNQFQNK